MKTCTDIDRVTYVCDHETCGRSGRLVHSRYCIVCGCPNTISDINLEEEPVEAKETCPCCHFEVFEWELNFTNDCPNCGTQLKEDEMERQLHIPMRDTAEHTMTDDSISMVIRLLATLLHGAKIAYTRRHKVQTAAVTLYLDFDGKLQQAVYLEKNLSKLKITTADSSVELTCQKWLGMSTLCQARYVREHVKLRTELTPTGRMPEGPNGHFSQMRCSEANVMTLPKSNKKG